MSKFFGILLIIVSVIAAFFLLPDYETNYVAQSYGELFLSGILTLALLVGIYLTFYREKK